MLMRVFAQLLTQSRSSRLPAVSVLFVLLPLLADFLFAMALEMVLDTPITEAPFEDQLRR
jgi:hypothetical protein